MPSYLWKNKKTDEEITVYAKIADREIPPDDSGDWFRPIVMPAHTRVSFLDGGRASDKAFQDVKQAAAMKVLRGDMQAGTEEYKEVTKAIDKLDGSGS